MEVLASSPSRGAIVGPWGPQKTEDSGTDGTGVGRGEARTEGAGA